MQAVAQQIAGLTLNASNQGRQTSFQIAPATPLGGSSSMPAIWQVCSKKGSNSWPYNIVGSAPQHSTISHGHGCIP